MAVSVNEKIRKLSPARCKKIYARAAELIAREMLVHKPYAGSFKSSGKTA
jgi:hypothetical protein